MNGYIWTVETGFYFSLPELSSTVFGPFASMMMAMEAASSLFDEQTVGLETYGGEELNLVVIELPPDEQMPDYSKAIRLHG